VPFPDFDPVIFQIGPFALRWYALAYVAGILLGWRYALALVKRDDLWAPRGAPANGPQIDDLILWITLGIIAGGRLGYVLFYQPSLLGQLFTGPDHLALFKLWEGGMAFHGGLIGVVLAVVWFAHKLEFGSESDETDATGGSEHAPADGETAGLAAAAVSRRRPIAASAPAFTERRWFSREHQDRLLRLGDLVAPCVPIGLFFGRVANFINGELWGRPTNLPWGVVFPGAGPEPRHPSQLYEAALEGIALFVLLRWATHHKGWLQRPGMVSGLFLLGYGLSRALMELVREPDSHMPEALRGMITMGMLLSIPMILFGGWLVWRAWKADGEAEAVRRFS
jgi:phosphatidylglycerol:prolipoprotein diacylglycerol transferase